MYSMIFTALRLLRSSLHINNPLSNCTIVAVSNNEKRIHSARRFKICIYKASPVFSSTLACVTVIPYNWLPELHPRQDLSFQTIRSVEVGCWDCLQDP